MKYGNRSLGKRLLASPFTMGAVTILAIVLIKGSWNIRQKANVSQARHEQAQQELNALKERQNEVSNKVSRLSTQEGIEAEIRTKFHAVKAGESVAVIVDESQTAAAKNSLENATSTVGWWGRMLRVFGFGR